jgi:ActR/RegA family two-component response regulator
MRDTTYNLFKGTSQENALWIGTVEGLQAATDRMSCLALSEPADYFVFHAGNIVASISKTRNALQPVTSPVWKIVIVSSDSNHLSALTEILKRQGLEPIRTPTVVQYRDVLSRHSVGLVFCDSTLSDGDYRDVINASRSLGSKVRIVVTSTQANWPEYLEAIRVGAFDVITAPCRPKDVECMVIQARRDDRKMAKQLITSGERTLVRGAAMKGPIL